MSYGKPHPEAIKLAMIFEEHSMVFGGDNYLSPTGWQMLSDKMETIEPLMRASVISDLMRELYNRNISYDREIFQNEKLVKGYED